jgi:uncharacterized membrane protein YhhN
LGLPSWFSGWHGIPNTPLTTSFFLAALAATNSGLSARYKWSIVAGLGFSVMGDVFLMLAGDYFVPGLGSFLLCHFCYLWAFTHDCPFARHKLPFVLWGALGIGLLITLWPGVAKSLRLPVIAYAAALLSMAAQAAARAMFKRNAAATLTAIGAGLFVVSDAVLSFQRFRHPVDWGRVIVLGTYFAAQGGIAIAVVLAARDRCAKCGGERHFLCAQS